MRPQGVESPLWTLALQRVPAPIGDAATGRAGLRRARALGWISRPARLAGKTHCVASRPARPKGVPGAAVGFAQMRLARLAGRQGPLSPVGPAAAGSPQTPPDWGVVAPAGKTQRRPNRPLPRMNHPPKNGQPTVRQSEPPGTDRIDIGGACRPTDPRHGTAGRNPDIQRQWPWRLAPLPRGQDAPSSVFVPTRQPRIKALGPLLRSDTGMP